MAAVLDLTLDQGATFNEYLTYKDAAGALINLTGFHARMQVRRRYADLDDEGPLVSLTDTALTSLSGILLGGTAGTLNSTDIWATVEHQTFVAFEPIGVTQVPAIGILWPPR